MAHDLIFVDDDPLFLERCKTLFADSPYVLHFLQSGDQCLRLIQDGLEPVALIVGPSVSGMDGPSLCAGVYGITPVTQLLMVVDECDFSLVARAVNQSGLFRVYTRDVADDELKRGVIGAVSLCLHRRQSLQAAKRLVEMNDELEDLTYHLEKTIDFHTHKLKETNEANVNLNTTLRRTVRELEGRDRVLRHLLTIHNLEDTLQTILEVIDDVLEISCGVVHVMDEGKQIRPVCVFPKECREGICLSTSRLVKDSVTSGRLEVENVVHSNQSAIAVPIHKDGDLLGVIEVLWHGKGELSEDELLACSQSIYTFTIHAAIAITDHNVSRDKSSWSQTLDDVLMDFME